MFSFIAIVFGMGNHPKVERIIATRNTHTFVKKFASTFPRRIVVAMELFGASEAWMTLEVALMY